MAKNNGANKLTARDAADQTSKLTSIKRTVPPVLPSIQAMSDEKTVHVFNVGPWPQVRFLGSLGRFFIPACTEGAPKVWERNENGVFEASEFVDGDPKTQYAAMEPLPGIVREPLPTDEKQMHWAEYEGKEVADQILGVGMMHSKAHSLNRLGIFRAAGKTPTKDELAAAREEMKKYMLLMIQEARTAYAIGPKEAEAQIRPEIHMVCARWLNLQDEGWMVNANPESRLKCEMCSKLSDAGTVICSGCGYIFDEAKYKQFKARMAS